MYTSTWMMGGFDALDDTAKSRIVFEMVSALIIIDMCEIRRIPQLSPKTNPQAPTLYDLFDMGRVKYAFQKPQDDWKDVVTVLQTGCGSCNSLAAFRCAELQLRGVDARPYVDAQMDNPQMDGTLLDVFHVSVQIFDEEGNPTNEFEDPSIELGMPDPDGQAVQS